METFEKFWIDFENLDAFRRASVSTVVLRGHLGRSEEFRGSAPENFGSCGEIIRFLESSAKLWEAPGSS